MRIITGDDTGLLKSIQLEAKKIQKLGEWRKGDAAERLCWGGPPENREARILAAFESGLLESRDGQSGEVLCSARLAPKVRCLQTLGDRVLAVSQDGSANIVANWCGEDAPAPPAEEEEPEEEAAAEGQEAKKGTGPGSFTLPGPIAGAQIDPCNQQRLVLGGGENDLKIYDLERQEVTWKAKNMKENFLCLRIPLKISALAWATPVAPSRSMILCGTTDGKLRLYDANAQRRPMCELTLGFMRGLGTGGHTGAHDDVPRPCTCLTVAPTRGTGWSVFMGNTMGFLREFDLRNLPTFQTAEVCPGRKSHMKWAVNQIPFKRAYSNMMGSVRMVDVHCNGNTLAAVGLGRFAYVYDVRKRVMTEKVYLKQKLCSVLFSSEERKAPKAEDDADEEGKRGEEPEEAGEEEKGEGGTQDQVRQGFSSDEEAGAAEGEEEEEGEEDGEEDGEEEGEEDDSDDESGQGQEDVKASTAGATSGSASQARGKRRRVASTKPDDRKKRKGRGGS